MIWAELWLSFVVHHSHYFGGNSLIPLKLNICSGGHPCTVAPRIYTCNPAIHSGRRPGLLGWNHAFPITNRSHLFLASPSTTSHLRPPPPPPHITTTTTTTSLGLSLNLTTASHHTRQIHTTTMVLQDLGRRINAAVSDLTRAPNLDEKVATPSLPAPVATSLTLALTLVSYRPSTP